MRLSGASKWLAFALTRLVSASKRLVFVLTRLFWASKWLVCIFRQLVRASKPLTNRHESYIHLNMTRARIHLTRAWLVSVFRVNGGPMHWLGWTALVYCIINIFIIWNECIFCWWIFAGSKFFIHSKYLVSFSICDSDFNFNDSNFNLNKKKQMGWIFSQKIQLNCVVLIKNNYNGKYLN